MKHQQMVIEQRNRTTKIIQSEPNSRQMDEKAAKMLEIYSKGSFSSHRMASRLRINLLLYVIRGKVIQNLKRVFDISIALFVLLLLSPIMIVTALLVKFTSPGPIFFHQERVGKWGKSFDCFKFRSMYIDAEERKKELMAENEADGPVFKMKKDPRITPIGRILRKTSIDELPQLFNVIRGDMSLVGPRPAVPQEVDEYDLVSLGRLNAIPGITGLQQVSGRSDLDFQRWIELDLQYIEEQSLLTDIKILLKTIPAVVFARGAY